MSGQDADGQPIAALRRRPSPSTCTPLDRTGGGARSRRTAVIVAAAAASLCTTTGCTSLAYYAQAAGGHLEVLRRARPVAEWLGDAETAAPLRERLLLSQRMRDFAVQELKLPDNGSYRRYADLGREAAVWNVVAAPALSLTLKTWCFPVMGCIGYRGYYASADAQGLAASLQADGWETRVYGVPAYSTLGFSNWAGGDPLLNTFIGWTDLELARLIFHELAHQVAYAADDTTFNESFAVAVERIGGARWLALNGTPAAIADAATADARQADFRALTHRFREELKALYGSAAPPSELTARKAAVMSELRAEHRRIRAERWGGYAGYDRWFEQANNASFGVLAAYNELVPAFERLFEREGRDFRRFYAAVEALAAMPKDERRAGLADVLRQEIKEPRH